MPDLRSLVLLLMVFGYPLLALIALAAGIVETRNYSIALRLGTAGLAVFAFFVYARAPIDRRQQVAWAALTVLFVMYAVRIYLDSEIKQLHLPLSTAEYFAYFILISVLPLLCARQGLTDASVARFLRGSIILALPITVLLKTFSDNYLLILVHGRFGTEVLNPITMGHLGVSLMIIGFFVAWRTPGWQPFPSLPPVFNQAIPWAVIAVGFVTMTLAASRGPMVAGLIVCALIWATPFSWARLVSAVLVAVAGVLVFLAIAGWASESFGVSTLNRAGSLLSDPMQDQSTSIRLLAYGSAISQFIENPLFGDAIVDSATGYYPHNIILEAFMATGFFGGMACVLFIAMGVRSQLRLINSNRLHGIVGFLGLQQVIATMFSGNIYAGGLVWYCLILAISLDAHAFRPGWSGRNSTDVAVGLR